MKREQEMALKRMALKKQQEDEAKLIQLTLAEGQKKRQ